MTTMIFVRVLEMLPTHRTEVCTLSRFFKFLTRSRQEINPKQEQEKWL